MRTKRILSILLVVAMLVTLLPVTALAHSGLKNEHSHKYEGEWITYDNAIVVRTGDSSMGKINQTEDDSTLSSGKTWHFRAEPNSATYKFTGWTFSNADLVKDLSSASSQDLSFSYKSGVGSEFLFGKKFIATANFDYATYYTLSTSVASGSGNISKDPMSDSYRPGTNVKLTAAPSDGYDFSGWTGDVISSSKTVTVNMSSSKTVYANFTAIPSYNLSLQVPTGGGTISTNPSGTSFLRDTKVYVTANPDAGWRFDRWEGTDSHTGDRDPHVHMTQDRTVKAYFVQRATLTLNVQGNGSLWRKSAVEDTYDVGKTIHLDYSWPVPYAGWDFRGWKDDATGLMISGDTITLNDDHSYTAIFFDGEDLYTAAASHGRLENDIDGRYERGQVINLNDAKPKGDPGYTLDCWKEFGVHYAGDGKIVDLDSNKNPMITIGDCNWFKAFFKKADYQIKYNLDGGTVSGNPSSYTYWTKSFKLNNPTKTGYTFKGWSGTGISAGTYSTNVCIYEKSTGDREYTANWTPNNYTVKYYANTGTGTMASSTHTYDVEQALNENTFTKSGCSFAGWALTPDGPVKYSNKQRVKNLATGDGDTVELYAKWNVSGITVTGYDNVYDGAYHGVTVSGAEGATVWYSVGDESNYSTTVPSFINVTSAGGTKVYVKGKDNEEVSDDNCKQRNGNVRRRSTCLQRNLQRIRRKRGQERTRRRADYQLQLCCRVACKRKPVHNNAWRVYVEQLRYKLCKRKIDGKQEGFNDNG